MEIPLGVRKYKPWEVHEMMMFLNLIDQCDSRLPRTVNDLPILVKELNEMLGQESLSQQQAAASPSPVPRPT